MSQRASRNKSNNLTQQTLKDTFSQVTINPDEIANNVVRYIIYRAGEHINFTKAELIRNVIHKAGNRYEDIINKVRNILKMVYGYNLIVCDSTKGKDKAYVVSNALPYVKDPVEKDEEIPEDVNKIILLLILSHVFMSNNLVSDVSLFAFLKSVGIDINLKHPVFGNVKDYIYKTLIKKQFLDLTVDNISRRQTFAWGLRAEKEISKLAILEFVCKIYKDRQPKDWINQFQVAEQQAFENIPENRREGPTEEQ